MKAVMIYDDFDSAANAVAMLQRAAGCAHPDARWDIRPWRVDVLRLAAAADKALKEALDADLIVLAGRRACSIPIWLDQWLEKWLRWRTTEDGALTAIPYEAARLPAVVAPRLSGFAARHGLELITGNPASRTASLVRPPMKRAFALESKLGVPSHDVYPT